MIAVTKPKRIPAANPLERASRYMFTRIVASLARTLRDEDLSVAQLAALHVVDQLGECKQSVLAAELALSPSAASRMVDGLVQRGLLERRESPEDRRVRTLSVAAHGHELLDAAGRDRVALIERVTRPFPRAMIQMFLANVERLRSLGADLLAREEEDES